ALYRSAHLALFHHVLLLLYLFLTLRRPTSPSLFPYTTLFRSRPARWEPKSGNSTASAQCSMSGSLPGPSMGLDRKFPPRSWGAPIPNGPSSWHLSPAM